MRYIEGGGGKEGKQTEIGLCGGRELKGGPGRERHGTARHGTRKLGGGGDGQPEIRVLVQKMLSRRILGGAGLVVKVE